MWMKYGIHVWLFNVCVYRSDCRLVGSNELLALSVVPIS